MRAGQKVDEGEVNAALEKETETDLREGEEVGVAVASDDDEEEEADEVDDKSDEEEEEQGSESEASEAEPADVPVRQSSPREEKVRLSAVMV